MPTLDELKKTRLEKIEKIRSVGWDPYATSFQKEQSVTHALQNEGKTVKTAGKLYSFRSHGNIAFADLKDETGKIQLFFKRDILGDEAFEQLQLLDIGDFIGVEGEVVRTIAGEISIAPTKYILLTKSIQSLPNEWFGLKDVESRFRQRYLDLLLNPEVRERFNARSNIIKAVREYLDNLNFWEVETPILQHLYGGANAKPFKTHFNALDADMYLRIAPELYLKRLIAGGYEKVYEVGKVFRNEGLDRSHNPEFTMLEWYESYADYIRVMEVAEGLFKHVAQKVKGKLEIEVDTHTINLAGKWKRITMVDILKEKLNLDVETASIEDLLKFCKDKKYELLGAETHGQLIFMIFEHEIPPLLVQPTWILDYPEDVSPLSKAHPNKPGFVQRFEGYIGGKEICDGWSELTDPAVQRDRFKRDEKAVRVDMEEAQHIDEDFLKAMEYGLPPLGGIGVGIDRLTMFFTNTWAIKEVILFPTLRPDKQEVKEVKEVKPVLKSNIASQAKSIITREKAFEILATNLTNQNLIRHCLAVEAAMKALARKFGEGETIWGIAGLLHDGDWEATREDPSMHTRKMVEWLENAGEPKNSPVTRAILSHNFVHNGENEPANNMEWALYTCDELTGFIVAVALILPSKKLSDVTVESVLKKFPSKSFASGVHREQIKICEEKLGIPLEEFVQIVLTSMQSIASDIGL